MRVLVVDDHPLFRDGIVGLLETAGFEVAGQANTGYEALEATRQVQPDLILMDLNMPDMDGLEALRAVKNEQPDIKVVVLTVSDEDDDLFAAIEAGADGYLLKNLNAQQFLEMLEGLERGEAAISRKTAARLMAGFSAGRRTTQRSDIRLTPKESELLKLVSEGLSNRAIAQRLSISENTVKYHLRNILQKLNAQNRTEAVTTAIQIGLLDTPGRKSH